MRPAILFVPYLLLVPAFALSACGGNSQSNAETQIFEAIDNAATSSDASKCTELMTANFRHQNSGLSGKAALNECREEASDTSDDPSEVTIFALEIDGSDATADVEFVGGGFDGQTVSVALVEDESQWKLDEVTGFAELDSEALAQTLEEQFEAASDEITPTQIKCIGDGIREAPQAEVEELLLDGSSQKFVEFAETCE